MPYKGLESSPVVPQGTSVLDDNSIARAILDAVPAALLVVDDDVRLQGYNRAASELLGPDPSRTLRRKTGDILHCLRSLETARGCGQSRDCADCVIRNSVGVSWKGGEVHRKTSRMQLRVGEEEREVHMMVTTAPLDFGGRRMILLILEDIGELVALRQALPICASCKRIRDDQQFWTSVESYFKRHLDLRFSHGMCPECIDKFYPSQTSQPSQAVEEAVS